ncbi:MAG: RluA family pseudouridine synthase [Eubacteriales bacterium]|nr:RluA family pseudouridine synthase [Eubacteriales bacterium]
MAGKKTIPVQYEDDSILVCEKPAGMPVQPDATRNVDLETYFKNYLFSKQEGEEEPYLTAVHRLDRPVGGLMVFAKTKQAAANLSEQIQNHEFEKCYQAVVCGELPEEFGSFEDYLLRDGKANMSRVVAWGTAGAKKAELEYELIDCIETKNGVLSWVLIMLATGRHHQIRVQFASRGIGLYGDTKYNPLFQKTKKKYIPLGLYSTRLAFCHPVTGEKMTFKTEPQGEAFELMDVEAY